MIFATMILGRVRGHTLIILFYEVSMRATFFYNILSCMLFTSIAYSSALNLKTQELKEFPHNLPQRDFFIIQQNLNISLQNKPTDCRANISNTICLVEPTMAGQQPIDRQCLDGGQQYAIYFENLYDNYPPSLQKMFCSAKRIFIEKSFAGTAYAGAIYDPQGRPTGAMIGIRQSVLDQNLSLSTWASWKEQLSFGGATDSYSPVDTLPLIQTNTNANVNEFLYFVIAHEFGHIFDFANGLNKTSDCTTPNPQPGTGDCNLAIGTWGTISWERTSKPRPQFDFLNRSGLCFYNCPHPLSVDNVAQVYTDLSHTNFISTYATTQPWDDFSDSLAYYLISKNLNASYYLLVNTNASSQSYDIIAKLHSEIFAEKYLFIEKFLNRTDIYYP